MVGYTLAHPVAVAFSGLPLALVSACGCIGVKESEHFSGLPHPLIRSPKALGSSSDRWKQVSVKSGKGQARLFWKVWKSR